METRPRWQHGIHRRMPRRITFAMEPFAWRAYGLRDLKPYRPSEIETIEREHDVRRIVIDGGWGRLSSLDLYTAADQVLADDEELSSVDYSASDTIDQFALFTVIGNASRVCHRSRPNSWLPRYVELLRIASLERRRRSSRRVSRRLRRRM